MARWDNGVFDSDDALDWISELEERGLEAGIKQTLNDLQRNFRNRNLEIPDCEISVALATTVAVLSGMTEPEDMPKDLAALIASNDYKPDPEIISESLRFLLYSYSEESEIMAEGVWGSQADMREWMNASAPSLSHLKNLVMETGAMKRHANKEGKSRRGCLWF